MGNLSMGTLVLVTLLTPMGFPHFEEISSLSVLAIRGSKKGKCPQWITDGKKKKS